MRHTRPKSAVPDMSFSLDVDSQIASRSKSKIIVCMLNFLNKNHLSKRLRRARRISRIKN